MVAFFDVASTMGWRALVTLPCGIAVAMASADEVATAAPATTSHMATTISTTTSIHRLVWRTHTDGINIGISFMMMGGVAFIMVLVCLVMQRNKKRSKNALDLLSETIAIFSAVMIFQAVNRLVEYHIIHHYNLKHLACWVHLVHFLAWFALFDIVMAHITNHHRNIHFFHRHDRDPQGCEGLCMPLFVDAKVERTPDKIEDQIQQNLDSLKLSIKSAGGLFAEVVAFSANNALGSVMQELCGLAGDQHPFEQKGIALVVALLSFFIFYVLTWCSRRMRAACSEEEDKADEFNREYEEGAREVENDAITVTCSFLLTQAFRFWITDSLPNGEGEDPKGSKQHSSYQGLAQIVIGVFMLLLGWFLKYKGFGEVGGSHSKRLFTNLEAICAKTMAWCFFFGAKWVLVEEAFSNNHGAATMHVALAVLLTSPALAFISVLDMGCVRNLRDSSGRTARFADQLSDLSVVAMLGLGVLVGFAWEQTFDCSVAGVLVLVENKDSRPIYTLLIAVLLCAVVLPPWYINIVPALLKADEHCDELDRQTTIRRNALSQGHLGGSKGNICGADGLKGNVRDVGVPSELAPVPQRHYVVRFKGGMPEPSGGISSGRPTCGATVSSEPSGSTISKDGGRAATSA